MTTTTGSEARLLSGACEHPSRQLSCPDSSVDSRGRPPCRAVRSSRVVQAGSWRRGRWSLGYRWFFLATDCIAAPAGILASCILRIHHHWWRRRLEWSNLLRLIFLARLNLIRRLLIGSISLLVDNSTHPYLARQLSKHEFNNNKRGSARDLKVDGCGDKGFRQVQSLSMRGNTLLMFGDLNPPDVLDLTIICAHAP